MGFAGIAVGAAMVRKELRLAYKRDSRLLGWTEANLRIYDVQFFNASY